MTSGKTPLASDGDLLNFIVSHPLQDLIGPLTFATREGAPIARIEGLSELVRGKLSAWLASLPDDAPEQAQAAAWLQGMQGYERLDADARRQRLMGVLEGVRQVCGGAVEAKSTRVKSGTAAPITRPRPATAAAQKKPAAALNRRLDLTHGVGDLRRVGPKRVAQLARLGIHSVGDLLLHLPSRYEDRREILAIAALIPGQPATVRGVVRHTESGTTLHRRVRVFSVVIEDGGLLGGGLQVRWFNQPHRARQLTVGKEYLFTGKVVHDRNGLGLVMDNPEFEPFGSDRGLHSGRLVAIYPVTEGLTSGVVRGWVDQALDRVRVPEPLPQSLLSRMALPSRDEALRQVHRPEADVDTRKGVRRLAFEEFFFLQLGLALKRRNAVVRRSGVVFPNTIGPLERQLRQRLPFALTAAQERVVGEIFADLARTTPMHRLLQGDVGCGKTVVALLALLKSVDHGYQGAIMAPTEILAVQHQQKLAALLDGLGVTVTLLLGGSKGKKQRLKAIADGSAQIVVGTQALIQDGVDFHRLGVVVIDEQHRFGVHQRARFGDKGDAPHTLIMTATPIPRSLSMTVYGDLDLSVIDALPPGRSPVRTRRYFENRRDEVYQRVRRAVAAGQRAYVVHPLVEASENLDLRAATEACEELAHGVLQGMPIGLLHGRMSGDEKARVMADFAAGVIQVLVTTTVVEVGVDVPEATVMVVEHAERFGLSQLHQLRGRVGRGHAPGECLLVASYALSDNGKARLAALVESTDGFYIAERDLEIRGPGELFGKRQSGVPELKVANLIRDAALLAAAREAARELIAVDPALSQAEHQLLRQTVTELWHARLKWGSVG